MPETVSSVRPCGGRISRGFLPVIFAIASCVFSSSARISAGFRSVRISCDQVWLATSWPSAWRRRTVSGCLSTWFLPSRKKVACTFFSLRMSRRCGVSSPGPASKVSAMHFALRQSTGPNEPLASEAASARCEAGAVVGVEQLLSVRASAAARAAARPVPIDFVFLRKAGHSLVAERRTRRATGADYTYGVYAECIAGRGIPPTG